MICKILLLACAAVVCLSSGPGDKFSDYKLTERRQSPAQPTWEDVRTLQQYIQYLRDQQTQCQQQLQYYRCVAFWPEWYCNGSWMNGGGGGGDDDDDDWEDFWDDKKRDAPRAQRDAAKDRSVKERRRRGFGWNIQWQYNMYFRMALNEQEYLKQCQEQLSQYLPTTTLAPTPPMDQTTIAPGSSTTPIPQNPTTAAPVTDAPTTAGPVTDAPTTAAPVTDAPTTAAPVTDAPTTAGPVTDANTTAATVTDAPSTAAPVTDAPTTAGPVTDDPTTAAPVTDAPTTGAPVTDALTTSALIPPGAPTTAP